MKVYYLSLEDSIKYQFLIDAISDPIYVLYIGYRNLKNLTNEDYGFILCKDNTIGIRYVHLTRRSFYIGGHHLTIKEFIKKYLS